MSLCLSLLPACLLSSPFSKDVRDTIRVVYHGRQLEKSRVAVTPRIPSLPLPHADMDGRLLDVGARLRRTVRAEDKREHQPREQPSLHPDRESDDDR